MVTKTQHIIEIVLNRYKDNTKSCINYNFDQFVLAFDDSVVGFIKNNPKAPQNGCLIQHTMVWDANLLKVNTNVQ